MMNFRRRRGPAYLADAAGTPKRDGARDLK
jgi:hypothetical protein